MIELTDKELLLPAYQGKRVFVYDENYGNFWHTVKDGRLMEEGSVRYYSIGIFSHRIHKIYDGDIRNED